MTFIRICKTIEIRKVRKRQSQYPEFGHTHGEIQKENLQQGTFTKPSILVVN
jgi:hypothetical protein